MEELNLKWISPGQPRICTGVGYHSAVLVELLLSYTRIFRHGSVPSPLMASRITFLNRRWASRCSILDSRFSFVFQGSRRVANGRGSILRDSLRSPVPVRSNVSPLCASRVTVSEQQQPALEGHCQFRYSRGRPRFVFPSSRPSHLRRPRLQISVECPLPPLGVVLE